MNIGSILKYKLILVTVVFIMNADLHAQGNSNGNNGNGNGVDPFALTVKKSGPVSLNFGAFVNVSGGNIDIDPVSLNPIPIANPADFIIVKNGTGPILFEVSNTATPLKVVNIRYQVTSPLSNGTSNLGLLVNFNSTRPLTTITQNSYTFTINELNPAAIYMGATLTVASGESPGVYTGVVSVTIDNQ